MQVEVFENRGDATEADEDGGGDEVFLSAGETAEHKRMERPCGEMQGKNE